MALTNAQAAKIQYLFEQLEATELEFRAIDRETADACKRARRELENYARASGINHNSIVGVTASMTAAASLPRRGRISR